MMNSKIEMKLGQLLEICPQLREMMTKSLFKMWEAQIVYLYKVTSIKVEGFGEAILVVQVHIGKFKVRDVLLDGVNIIFEGLNLKIDLVGCEYKIFVIVLNMGNETETFSMFLGRPWLKQAKANHNRIVLGW